MDVSKDNIVLKEVGNTYNQGSTRALVSTKAPDNAGVYSNNNNKGNAQVAAEDKEAVKNIAILTGEDYASIEKEEGNIEDCREEDLERAAQKIKEQKEWKEFYQESNKELCQQLKEGLENIQKQGFLDQKSESQIAQVLREADIPPTLENISRVVSALQMSLVAGDMSDKAKSYIISKGMSPTIENIYHGQFSVSNAYDLSVYDKEIWESPCTRALSSVILSLISRSTSRVLKLSIVTGRLLAKSHFASSEAVCWLSPAISIISSICPFSDSHISLSYTDKS